MSATEARVLAQIEAAVAAAASLPYGGERVDQRQHALQCAALARAAGADAELTVAALLHDIGRSPAVLDAIGPDPGVAPDPAAHGEVAASWLRPRTGERIAWLVEQHVPAKRFLCTVEPDHELSEASARSLRSQGGAMSTEEVERFRSHEWWEDAVALRRWDDLAKDPNARVLPIEAYEPELRAVISAAVRER